MDTHDPINLADYYSLADAARQLRKSEKQTRRYIEQGRLPGSRMIGRMLYIPRSSVQAMLESPVQLEDTLTRRVRLLEAEMVRQNAMWSSQFEEFKDEMTRKIDQRLDEMAGQIRPVQARTDESQRESIIQSWDTLSRRPPVPPVVKSTVPDGLVVTREFARAHGLRESTVQNAIDGKTLAATRGEWKVGKATVKWAFDEEQRRACVEQYRDNAHFHQCDVPGCPCRE